MKKLFTKEQEDFILENYETMKYKDIGKKIGDFTALQICSWINAHKDKIKNTSIFTEKDIEFIKKNYKNLSYKEIANILGYTERQVRGKINNMGLKKRISLYNGFFKNIDTPNKAYWLGFIYADGYLESGKNKGFGMSLQERDKYALENLKNLLGVDNELSFRERECLIPGNKAPSICRSYTLRINSKEIYEDLLSNNIVVKKTYSTTFPKVPDNLFFDFLRGYIDGDGYISNNNGYIHVGLVSHNNEILKYIQDKLLEYNIHSKIYLEERNNSHIYRFRCFKVEDVKKLLNHLYEDVNSQKLERKYEKYKSFYEGSPS